MPRKRAPALPVPSREAAAHVLDDVRADGARLHATIKSQAQEWEAARGKLPEHLRHTIEQMEQQGAKLTAHIHLRHIGADKSVELLFELFGRKEVQRAYRATSRVLVPKSREYFVWLSVELHRAVTGQSTEQTCKSIARAGGIRGWRVTSRGETSELVLNRSGTIKREYRRAVARLKSDPATRALWSHCAVVLLADWRTSGKSFDPWEREHLRKPGWRFH